MKNEFYRAMEGLGLSVTEVTYVLYTKLIQTTSDLEKREQAEPAQEFAPFSPI